MINQVYSPRRSDSAGPISGDLNALCRRVAIQKRLDAIKSSETAGQIKTALMAIAAVALFFALMGLAQAITDRADHKTTPAEQSAGTRWRN